MCLYIYEVSTDPVKCLWKALLWGKLPNSGDTLKLMVPSHNRKVVSGQNNYLGMVTSHKMMETEMGYRGTKSVGKTAVKAQRADGSWYITPQNRINRKVMYLRCALMGFERNYQLSILSSQCINLPYSNKRHFTLPASIPLDPWFISGFADAEGSFMILVQPTKTGRWKVKAIFAITLHVKDIALLNRLIDTLGVGKIWKTGPSKVIYRVESFKDLDIIIAHFDQFPLITAKILDYFIFKECFGLMKQGAHLTQDGLLKILGLKSSLNRGLPENLSEAFPDITPVPKPDFIFKGIPHPMWVAGFTSGDGSFFVRIRKRKLSTLVEVGFSIGQLLRELQVINAIAATLLPLPGMSSSPKYVYLQSDMVLFNVTNFSHIVNYIVPFFTEHPIQGQKALDFNDFKSIVELMQNKAHLTPEGIDRIIEIKGGMNQNRFRG